MSSPVWSHSSLRVDKDIGADNDDNFYSVDALYNQSDLLMPDDGRPYFMGRLNFSSQGYGIYAEFKNLIFKDITETDTMER